MLDTPWLRALALLALTAPLAACGGASGPGAGVPADDELDPADDSFMAGGKTDVFGIADGSAEACAVLRLANEGSFELLDVDVALNATAARKIVEARSGADGTAGTHDDRIFADLAALDAVPYVGKQAFKRLLSYSQAHSDTLACGVVNVQLLAFNDFHGNLKPPSGSSGKITTGPVATTDFVEAGGVEYLATHVNALRATNPNTLVMSAGDIIGASPLLSGLFHDEPTVEAMNALGLQLAVVGNHEFDEGPEELLRIQGGGCHPVDGCKGGGDYAGAGFQYLAANVVQDATGETLLAPYEIRYFQGARIGVIGVTTEGTPLVTTPAGIRGLSFRDEAETVNALVPKLKAEGAQTIVVLLHEGGYATGLYNECKGASGPAFEIAKNLDPAVSVVITGHTNALHVCDVDGRLVTGAANNGRLVTDIDLSIDARTGEVLSKTAANVIATRTVAKDPQQSAIIAKWDTLAAPLANQLVGSATGDLVRTPNAAGESPLGDVIADAQLGVTAAADKGNAIIAFMNPGGIRADIPVALISGGEQPGEVTYAEAFSVQPFGNNVVSLTLTGADIDTLLEQQWSVGPAGEKANMLQVSEGFTYEYDPAQPVGSRIDPSSIRLNGVVIDPNATYRVTCNSFLAEGGDGFAAFKNGTDRLAGVLDLDALLAWFAAHSPVAPGPQNRIIRK